MNEQNFIKRVEFLVSGDGFVREAKIPLSACIATGASAPALSSNVLVATFDANDESLTIPFQVPLDYDASQDALAVCMTALLTTGDLSAGTNLISLDLDQVNVARPGETAVTDESANVTSDAQSVDDAAITEYTWDLSSLGLLPGDVMSIEIDAQETGTAVATIYGVSVRYRSDLTSYDQDKRGSVDVTIDNA